MNPPAPSVEISLDPIIYFYTHSLVIIVAVAVVFLGLGIWIGHLTWAKFKRRARAFQEECDLLRHEIASLKRKIGEDTTSTAPLVLINEDAPLPEAVESELPGFEFLKIPPAQPFIPPAKPAPAPAPTIAEEVAVSAEIKAPEPTAATEPSKPEPARESLASVVIGVAGAPHHTLEPTAPPDSITELVSVSPSSNGVHPPAAATETAPPQADITPEKQESPAPTVAEPEPKPEPEPTPEPKSQPQAEVSSAAPTPVEPPTPPKTLEQTALETPPEPTPVDANTAFANELTAGIAVADPTLGIILHSKPDRWDDLTLLRGVGEVLEQRLHASGVHTFKQIAYWTDQNVAAFSTKIEARDRIQRERWVTQARDMHFLKYGEKLG